MTMSLPAFVNPQPIALEDADLDLGPGGGGPPMGAPLAAFPLETQALTLWCWAAVGSGMATSIGDPISQCKLAERYGPYTQDAEVRDLLTQNQCCPPSDGANSIGYLHEVLNLLEITHTYELVSAATAGSIPGRLAADRPVGVYVKWNQGGWGHFTAIVGISDDGLSFLVYDPSTLYENSGQIVSKTVAQLDNYDGHGAWNYVYYIS